MSTSVKIALTPTSEIPILELINPEKHAFGVRDEKGKFTLADFAQTTVVFNRRKIGRGVELTFELNYVEVRLCAPSTTSDYEVFMDLVEKLIKILGVQEIICEEENIDISHIAEVRETAEANLASALDFISSVPLQKSGPVSFAGVFQEIVITPPIQRKLLTGKQRAFDELLYATQKPELLATH